MKTVESFTLDHTKVLAPYVRKCKSITTPNGDKITKFDIRLKQPNKQFMDVKGAHTLEHLIAYEFATTSPWESIDSSCMACMTGIYWSVIGDPSEEDMILYLRVAFSNILNHFKGVSNRGIPGATEVQCGNYRSHDMALALSYIEDFLDKLGTGHY